MWQNCRDKVRRVASQFFSGKHERPFCPSCTFIFRNERKWMKKSARVSEKTGKPGLTWLTGSYAPESYKLQHALLDCVYLGV